MGMEGDYRWDERNNMNDYRITIERRPQDAPTERRINFNMSVPISVGDKLKALLEDSGYRSTARFLGDIIEKIVDDIKIVDPIEDPSTINNCKET